MVGTQASPPLARLGLPPALVVAGTRTFSRSIGLGTLSDGVNTMLTIVRCSLLQCFRSSPSSSVMASHLDCGFGGAQEKGRRLDTSSLNPLWKPGEEPPVLFWPGLALIDRFPPSFLLPAPAPRWGLALQDAFWAKPSQKRKTPSWFLFIWMYACGGTSFALPFFRGGGWQEELLDRAVRGQLDSFQQMVQRGRSCVNLPSPPERQRLNSERAERQLQAGEGRRKKENGGGNRIGEWNWGEECWFEQESPPT